MDARRPTPDCDAATAEIAGVEIAGERRKTGGKSGTINSFKKNGGDFLAISCAVYSLTRRITVFIS